jgi:hypothetical protein
MRHRWEIERTLGHDIGPAPAAEDYAETVHPPSPMNRLTSALRGLLALPKRIARRGD